MDNHQQCSPAMVTSGECLSSTDSATPIWGSAEGRWTSGVRLNLQPTGLAGPRLADLGRRGSRGGDGELVLEGVGVTYMIPRSFFQRDMNGMHT